MVYLLKMVIFHCYVSSPEGNQQNFGRFLKQQIYGENYSVIL